MAASRLGFRSRYPQIETKLTVLGIDQNDTVRKLAPCGRPQTSL
jgi:hypothetical protein